MDSLLTDYKAYYRVRMERYEGDPNYPNSYQSEKALYEAMNSCNELSEFRDKVGNLMVENAIALVKDEESARLKYFEQHEETVRALAPKRILEKIDSAQSANDVAMISSEAEQEVSNLISIDGFYDIVRTDLIPLLEDLEVTKQAVIPSKYEQDRQRSIAEIEASIRTRVQDVHEQARHWDPNWSLDLSVIWETRHRKKIALDDAQLEKRLNQIKTYL
ncbi:MAG: hypothetical protein NXI10_01930 [bacterium]|nr:hypothetical protein [bacterium]